MCLYRLILLAISKHVIMMPVVATWVATVNVCVRLLLHMPGSVTDMAFISSGDHNNFVVSPSNSSLP